MTAPHTQSLSAIRIKDRDWIRKSFMITEGDLQEEFKFFRYFSSADAKFTNTTLGGNFAINPPPQYTRYADIRRPGIGHHSRSKSEYRDITFTAGMGRFYSEQLDDTSEYVHMQLGVPDYNGMLTFFTGFYDSDASILSNEGRLGIINRVAYSAGKVLGLVLTIPFARVIALGYLAKFFLNRAQSKYYVLKPTMAPYWNRVNLLVNTIAADMGIIARTHTAKENVPTRNAHEGGVGGESGGEIPSEMIENPWNLAPDIFHKTGGIDVYKVASKAQRLANAQYRVNKRLAEESFSDRDQIRNRLIRYYKEEQGKLKDPGGLVNPRTKERGGIANALELYHGSILGNIENRKINAAVAAAKENILDSDLSDLSAELDSQSAQQASKEQAQEQVSIEQARQYAKDTAAQDGWFRPVWRRLKKGDVSGAVELVGGQALDSEAARLLEALLQDGAEWITFRVDESGPASESFSNSTKESGISQKLNGVSSSARDRVFDFSRGETGIAPIDGIFKSVKSMVAGVLDGIHLSGLMALAGSAYIDFPKHWDSSTANFTSMSYTIQLRSPYGHPLARLMNLYVPLSMILAAALPLSTGKQSYTSPFLCQLYNKGKVFSRLGMITSLSITRGTGNLGFNKMNEALGIDVSFTVTDMSSVLHAPIDAQLSAFAPWKGVFDDDNAFVDYLATLGNMDLQDQIYTFRKLKIKMAKKKFFMSHYFDTPRITNEVNSWFPARMLSGLARIDARSQL